MSDTPFELTDSRARELAYAIGRTYLSIDNPELAADETLTDERLRSVPGVADVIDSALHVLGGFAPDTGAKADQ